jgi:hypothetical protein
MFPVCFRAAPEFVTQKTPAAPCTVSGQSYVRRIMKTAKGRSKDWKELPGVFDWAEVVDLVQRCTAAGKRMVRASLVRIDRSGIAFYRVFTSDTATATMQ